MTSVLVILLMISAIATADTCHDLDRYDALQDVAMRWMAEHDNPATMVGFNRLSRNWKRLQFLSTNPCIRFEIKADTEVTAVFSDPNDVKEVEYDRSEITSSRQLRCLRDPNCVWKPEVQDAEAQTLDTQVLGIEEDEVSERERLYPLLEIAYVPHTGLRYHTATCFWRGFTPREMTVLDAMLKGRTPCLRCNPPTVGD